MTVAGAGVSGSDFLSLDSLRVRQALVVRHQKRALGERRVCVTVRRELRLQIAVCD